MDPPVGPAWPMRRACPGAVPALACAMLGLWLGRTVEVLTPALAFSAGAGLCAAAVWAGSRRAGSPSSGPRRLAPHHVLLALAVVALAAGWIALRLRHDPPGSLRARLADTPAGAVVRAEGLLLDDPSPLPGPAGALAAFVTWGDEPGHALTLRVRRLLTDDGPVDATGRLRLRVDGLDAGRRGPGAGPFRAGDWVRVTGLFEPVGPPMNPGQRDRRPWAAQEGLGGWLRVSDPSLVEAVAPPDARPLGASFLDGVRAGWARWRADLRARASALLPALPGADPGGDALVRALILGEVADDLRDARDAFTRLGLAHALAISGFHLVVMAGLALALLRAVGDLGGLESLALGVGVGLYLLVVPAEAPVLRSGIMVLALLAGEALGRRYDRLGVLALTGLALLVWRPMDLWSLGFQLSFGLTAALLWLGEWTHARLFGAPLRGTLPPLPQPGRPALDPVLVPARRALGGLVSTTLLCWALSAPLIAWSTGQFSPLTLIAGVLVTPFIVLLLWGGYAALLLGALAPPLGGLAGALLGPVASLTLGLVSWLDALPGAALRVPAFSAALALALTALALGWILLGHARDRRAWLLTLIAGAWLAAEVALGGRPAPGVRLRIDTLAVGDGTCHIVRAGGHALLWDCGSTWAGAGRAIVPRAARALGVRRTPVAVLTHANFDHYSGLLDVADPLGVRTVLVGASFLEAARRHEPAPAFLLEQLARRGIEVRSVGAGDRLDLGPLRVEFLSPAPDADDVQENDRALVGLIEVPTDAGPRRALFTGDIQDRAIARLRERHPGLRADWVEAPHHGSAREPAVAFVGSLGARVVAQSTGPSRVGDPRWDGVRRHTRWLCSALDGAFGVEFWTDGSVRARSMLDRR